MTDAQDLKIDPQDLKDYMLKEVDVIQGIINRMANNSFLIKGWTVTLVVVALLLEGSKYQVAAAAIPLIGFWGLDAYFLYIERLYRERYKCVIEHRLTSDKDILSMDFTRFKYSEKNKKGVRYRDTFFSSTLIAFYGIVIALTMTIVIAPLVVTLMT